MNTTKILYFGERFSLVAHQGLLVGVACDEFGTLNVYIGPLILTWRSR